jgi:hypothetical protein
VKFKIIKGRVFCQPAGKILIRPAFPLPAQDFDNEVDISDKLNTLNAGVTEGPD